MKNRYIMLLVVVMGCINLSMAQTEIQKKILDFENCFPQFSNPNTHNASYSIGGKQVPVVEKTDFGAKRFAQVDPQLNNVKLMLMDNKDLSTWERADARKICDSYFADGMPGFHIAAHGLEDETGASANKIKVGGQELTPEETANLIFQTLKNFDIILDVKKEPFPIVLHTCKSGQGGDNSYAAELSKILSTKISNVAVIASPDLVCCEVDNKGNYNEYVSNRFGGKHGNWLVFQNGKQTMQGTPDYKSTVKKYMGK